MSRKITIALVGRPNVGKSTLFNCLTRSRAALVADIAGLTRDRQYGEGLIEEHAFRVIDTGGLSSEQAAEGVYVKMAGQALQAVEEADVIFFLVDAQKGVVPEDQWIAQELREANKPIILVVNKIDGRNENIVLAEFYSLGFPFLYAIAAAHGRGISALIDYAFASLPELSLEEEDPFLSFSTNAIRVAIVGRPNVGKSTLINRLLGEERVVVYDEPGTTRDSIYIPFKRFEKDYTLIDTAGIRKKGRVDTAIEKFSVVKTLAAIDSAHVVIMIINAHEGVVEQDLHLLGYIIEAGRALVIGLNKWDGLEQEEKQKIVADVKRRLTFADFAKVLPISALHGTGVGHLYRWIDQAHAAAGVRANTHEVTQLLEQAVEAYQPPMVRGRRIKLRYAHMGGTYPPTIVVHGNQTQDVPTSYKRYLINFFHEKLNLTGTPLRVEFKTGENPFAGRRNTLTPRQKYKRERLMKHVRGSKKKK